MTINIILRFGVCLGASHALLQVIQYATNNHLDPQPHWAFTLLSFAISIGVIVWGMKLYKVKNSELSLGKALKIGVGIAVVSGFTLGIYNIIFTTLIEPDFIEKSLEKTEQFLFEQGKMSDEQIEQSIEMAKKMSSPLLNFVFGIISSAFLGLVIAIIAGMILKTPKKQ